MYTFSKLSFKNSLNINFILNTVCCHQIFFVADGVVFYCFCCCSIKMHFCYCCFLFWFMHFNIFLPLSFDSPFSPILFSAIRYEFEIHATPVKYLFPVCNFYGRLLKETKSFPLRQLDSCLMPKDTLQKWYYLSAGVFLSKRAKSRRRTQNNRWFIILVRMLIIVK